MVVASEPMVMQPAIARQNMRDVWLYNQLPCHRISDFFSSATNSLLRWLFADAGIRRWNASSSRIRTSRSNQLADSVIPCSHPASIQRSSLKEQISQLCCKCCAVIVRHAGLPCKRMTLTLSVCHAWGNTTLTLRSAGLTALIARVSVLASQCSRIAFFSESDSAPPVLLLLPVATDLRRLSRQQNQRQPPWSPDLLRVDEIEGTHARHDATSSRSTKDPGPKSPWIRHLGERVLNTMAAARASSTRRLYALKWSISSAWCKDRDLDLVTSDVSVVLSLLQGMLDKQCSSSTIKVYVAAIAVFHAPICWLIGGQR